MFDSHFPQLTHIRRLQHHRRQPQPQPQPRRHQHPHQQHQQGSLDSDTIELNMDSYLAPSSAPFASPVAVHSGTSARYHPLSAQVSASASASPSTSTSRASTLHANTTHSCHKEERRLRTFADDSGNCRRLPASSSEIASLPTADKISALGSGSSHAPQASPGSIRDRKLSLSTSTSQPDPTSSPTPNNSGWLGGISPLPHNREGVNTWLHEKGLFSSQPALKANKEAVAESRENSSQVDDIADLRRNLEQVVKHGPSETNGGIPAQHSRHRWESPTPTPSLRSESSLAARYKASMRTRWHSQTSLPDLQQSVSPPVANSKSGSTDSSRKLSDLSNGQKESELMTDWENMSRTSTATTDKSAAQGKESQNNPETETPEVPSRGSSTPETPIIDAYKNMNGHSVSLFLRNPDTFGTDLIGL